MNSSLTATVDPRPSSRPGEVALSHDYLNQWGGAERVALELARMWPDAPLYTALYRPRSTFPELRDYDIRTSPLDRIPSDRGFRSLLPLYPLAWRSFGQLDYDMVISSSSGWAHGVHTARHTFHVVYCHTPARWIYTPDSYLGAASWQQRLARPLIGAVRWWDQRAARRADLYIANSRHVAQRIKAAYGIDAEVVPPPVDVDRFTPRERGERLLVVSRLLDYKRVDAIVRAATMKGWALDVVGRGPSEAELRRIAGPSVVFHGTLTDADVTDLMEGCRALVVPGEEDFGITPVEAQAAGKPVVALARGGALETVIDGVTGALFDDYEPETVIRAVERADALEASPHYVAGHAARFSVQAFNERLLAAIARHR